MSALGIAVEPAELVLAKETSVKAVQRQRQKTASFFIFLFFLNASCALATYKALDRIP
jgi:hypothetical protein